MLIQYVFTYNNICHTVGENFVPFCIAKHWPISSNESSIEIDVNVSIWGGNTSRVCVNIIQIPYNAKQMTTRVYNIHSEIEPVENFQPLDIKYNSIDTT